MQRVCEMRITNRCASAAFKALLAAGGWTGILLQCGVFSGRADFSALRYYTLLSNVLVAVYFTVAAVSALRGDDRPLPRFKGALIMGITVTGIVYHLLLSDGAFSMGGSMALANQLLHTFTPIMSVLDWLLFDEKGRYGPLSPVLWTWLPNLYFVLATLYGFTVGIPFYGGRRFPYFFIDYDALGVGGVLLYVLALNVAFIALGYVFVLLDWLLKRAGSRLRGAGAIDQA